MINLIKSIGDKFLDIMSGGEFNKECDIPDWMHEQVESDFIAGYRYGKSFGVYPSESECKRYPKLWQFHPEGDKSAESKRN
jgi:hypothetical protein